MHALRRRIALLPLALFAVVSCSSTAGQPAPAERTTPTSASATSSTTAPTSTSATTSARPPEPRKPRTISACADGRCRLWIAPGDRLRLNGVLGAFAVRFKSISRSKVVVQVQVADGALVITDPKPLRGEGLSGPGSSTVLRYLKIEGSRALIEVGPK